MNIGRIYLDRAIALLILIILSPCILLISILIKVESKGPVLFNQKRIGKDNVHFILHKFRSMRIDTPHDIPTHLFSDPEDYVTVIGKILRKTSLDELPQLINIIKGEMVFVGPRPALYNQYDLIDLRTKHGIQTLIPGITGWAQVNGRDEPSIEEKVELDYYYYQHRSLKLDLVIIYMTIKNVLTSKGIKA